ncbi:CHAT domain-containing protein [Mycena rebaudengoi]|nr:CHAT domain-containing protein [Mycena rebaudengoi]
MPSQRACEYLSLAHLVAYAASHASDNESSIRAAVGLFKSVAKNQAASLKDRMLAAKEWAEFPKMFQAWKEAPPSWLKSSVEAYRLFFQLLNIFLITVPDVTNQHTLLASVPDSIISDAAVCAIRAGMPETAVELLEYGRDLIMGNLRTLRTMHPSPKVSKADPNLVEKFLAIKVQGRHPGASEEEARLNRMAILEDQVRSQKELLNEFDGLLLEIRRIDERFLLPAPFSELRKADAEGPIIIPIASLIYGCEILIIHGGEGGPVHVAVPVDMSGLSRHFLELGDTTQYDRSGLAKKTRWYLVKCQHLFRLISSALAELKVPEQSRIWWMLPGKSTFLPFHIASEKHISSYTTSLAALMQARSGKPPSQSPPTLLAIGVSKYTKWPDLPVVELELDGIELLNQKGFVNATILRGQSVDRSAVLQHLNNHSSIHFSGHGSLSRDDPFESALILSEDRELTLREIMSLVTNTSHDFAFMSSCHTATRDIVATPDEHINLATAVLSCGFFSAIGSLFVGDVPACALAEAFYRMKMIEGNDTATALHLALEEKVKEVNNDWTDYITFVHIGA